MLVLTKHPGWAPGLGAEAKVCAGCRRAVAVADFSTNQWRQPRPRCLPCAAARQAELAREQELAVERRHVAAVAVCRPLRYAPPRCVPDQANVARLRAEAAKAEVEDAKKANKGMRGLAGLWARPAP